MAKTIITKRLTLRPLLDSDAANIALFVGDARVANNLAVVPHPYPAGAAESYIAYSRAPETREDIWGIDKDGQLIGMISLSPKQAGMAGLGYWLASQLWGAGLMTEAVKAVVEFARSQGFKQLFASVHQGNKGSAKVLIRNGFEYVGDAESHSIAQGGPVLTWEYLQQFSHE